MIDLGLNKETIYRIKALRDMTVDVGGDGEGVTEEVRENDIFDGQYELTTDKGNFLCFWISDPDQGFGEDFADYVYFPVDGVEVRELRGVQKMLSEARYKQMRSLENYGSQALVREALGF